MNIFERLHVTDLGALPVRESSSLLFDFIVGKLDLSIARPALKARNLKILLAVLVVGVLTLLFLVAKDTLFFSMSVIVIAMGLMTFAYQNSVTNMLNGLQYNNELNHLSIDDSLRSFKKVSIAVNDPFVTSITMADFVDGEDKSGTFVVVEFKRKRYLDRSVSSIYGFNKESQLVPEFIGIDPKSKQLLLRTNGRCESVMSNLNDIDDDVVGSIRGFIKQLHQINATRVRPVIIKTDSNNYYIVSTGDTNFHKKRNAPFYLGKNADKHAANSKFGLDLLTKEKALELLTEQRKKYDFLYSTAYFFNGIGFGLPWARSHGYGRWLYILRDALVPHIKDKVVLDLGSNTGILPLYMLKSGAKKVIAIEKDPLNAETMKIYKKIFEWQDDKDYDLSIHNMDMLEVMQDRFKDVDVVTTLCSIYYISEAEINELMTWVFDNIGTLVVESNEDSLVEGRKDKAQLRYLAKMAESVGFSQFFFYEPEGFHRPLFIAKR